MAPVRYEVDHSLEVMSRARQGLLTMRNSWESSGGTIQILDDLKVSIRLYMVVDLCLFCLPTTYTTIFGLPCKEVQKGGKRLAYQTKRYPEDTITINPPIGTSHLL